MYILWVILIGFLIGLVARFLLPGKDPGGFVVTSLVGIAGSLVGQWLGQAFGFYTANEPVGFVASVVGAMIFLVLLRAISGRGHYA